MARRIARMSAATVTLLAVSAAPAYAHTAAHHRPPSPNDATCMGYRVTLDSSRTVVRGSNSRDVIITRNPTAKVYGYGGDDVICILTDSASTVTVYGGAGDDIVYGSPGADTLYGEYGDDTLYGNAGDDYLNGGPGADLLAPGTGNDTVIADPGDTVT